MEGTSKQNNEQQPLRQEKEKKENEKETSNSSINELRMRTDSEGSTDSLTRFVVPSVNGSPPKVLTMDELSTMFKDLKNMELAHEIALNPDFKLQKYEPPQDSLEGRIKAMVHKAFWDVLREELESTPPRYDQAIRLLAEIKDDLPQLLTEKNSHLLETINSMLDEDHIRCQAENGTLDFFNYVNYVIFILSKLCCPARDEAVAKLREIEDVVDTFHGILETMALMKLDIANFVLSASRNVIANNSVQYEKKKFTEFLRDLHGNAGFPATEDWLQRHRTLLGATATNSDVIYNAFMQLLEYPADKEFPEVLCMDKMRFQGLGWRYRRIILNASLISIAQGVPFISQRDEYRKQLAEQLYIITQDLNKEDQIPEILLNCYEQMRAFINKILVEMELPAMPDSHQQQLKAHVQNLQNSTSAVRTLMHTRLDAYVRLALRSNGNNMPPPPTGFVDLDVELVAFMASFRRLVSYNCAVFGEYLIKTLSNQLSSNMEPTPTRTTSVSGPAQAAKP